VAENGRYRPFFPQNYTLCHSSERNREGQGGLRDFFNRDKDLGAASSRRTWARDLPENQIDSGEIESDFSDF
jgi:hypothetical protein